MPLIEHNFSRLNRKLRYGVIYVVTAANRLNSSDIVSSQWISSRLLSMLRSLTGFDIEVVESLEAERTTLVARRINVGNAGTDSVVRMPLNYDSVSDVIRFVKSATDVLSTDKGDQVLEPEDYRALTSLDYIDSSVAEVDLEEDELQTIEHQQEEALMAIQAQILDYVKTYHADPSDLIHTLLEGKIVIGKDEQQSPLVVNNDLKIVLPHYNEMEVKMPAMCRTIYILFLKHPEGIALRNISEYRADLENIYSMVMPGRSEEKAKEAIENLIDPMSNTLNEYISKIKRCFKTCILDDELASQYCITGKRGEPYRIALDPALITLPRAVKGE